MLTFNDNFYKAKISGLTNMEKEALEGFGLSEKEIKIYLQLLREKSCTAAKLAKLSNLNRTTAYLELDNLMKIGIVNYTIKNSKRYYQPASPDKLLFILDEKKEKIKAILPELKALHSTDQPFKIEVFEGRGGIKTFYQDILNSVKEFYVIGATGEALNVMEFSYPHFLRKFIKSGIKERALANLESKRLMENIHPKKFLEIRYLPQEYKAKVTTIVYGEKVAIQSLQKENIYVVVIKDKLLAQTYKTLFEFMWKAAEK